MISSLLTYLLVGVIAIVVAGVVLSVVGAVFGIAFGLAGFLLFKVAPLVLIGYLVVRFLAPKRKQLSEADRKWLED
jgi:uncharacterized membrane protein